MTTEEWNETLKNNYILVDLENVQPTNLDTLSGRNFKVIVFVGANQAKLSFELAVAMQALGSNATYIKIDGNGPNALDFHIAFYMGKIAEKDSNAYFHIISKDTGFDPLIKHLRDSKILAQRVTDITEIASLQSVSQQSPEARISAVMARLKAMGDKKPRKVQGLENTIRSLFSKQINESDLTSLIKIMKARKLIFTEGEKLTYQ